MYSLLHFQQKHIILPSGYLPFHKPALKHRTTNDGTKLLYTFDSHIINKNQPLRYRFIAMRFFNIHNILTFLPAESMMQKLSDGTDSQLIRRWRTAGRMAGMDEKL